MLGTDGFGRCDTRQALRRFFEVDAECIVIAMLYRLDRNPGAQAIKDLGVNPGKNFPQLV